MIVKENAVGSLVIYTENENESDMIGRFLITHSNNLVKSCIFHSKLE